MMYTYIPPRPDVFGFFIFTLVGGTAAVIIKDTNFRQSAKVQHLTSACILLVAFILPATICLRLSLSQHSSGPAAWTHSRQVLFAEAGVDIGMCLFIALLSLLKFQLGHETIRKAGFADLHWRISLETLSEAKAKLQNANIKETPSGKYLYENSSLWYLNISYLLFRFLLVYIVFIPFSVGCNLYIAFNLYALHLNTGVTDFNDTVFFITFGLFLILATLRFFYNFGLWQAWTHFILLFHCVLICYFVTDSAALAKLELGFLAIYLSTIYDMIADTGIRKIYNLPWWWYFQTRAWSEICSIYNNTEVEGYFRRKHEVMDKYFLADYRDRRHY